MSDGKIFEYPLMIRESHLDTFGHVNNATYLQLFEEARWEIITQNGFGLDRVHETGQGPVILEVHIRFMKELKLRSHVTIKTQITEWEGKINKLRQWIENEKGQNCCEAEFTFSLFDTKARKIIAPTPEWLKALGIN